MQPYFGSLEAINNPRNAEILRRRHSPYNSPKEFLNRKRKENLATLKQQHSQPQEPQVVDCIRVNVSGKCFQISLQDLAKYPESLLSDETKRRPFFDSTRNEYFFDHNRIVAESVYNFYQYGFLIIPENIPEYLFIEEIAFYCLQDYLDKESKELYERESLLSQHRSSRDWRDKLWFILESPDDDGDVCARAYNIFSLSLILFSIFLLCYDTAHHMGELQKHSGAVFYNIAENWVFLSETICISYFTVELFLRFIVSHEKSRFLGNTLNIIDFVAIVPFYMNIFLEIHRITAPLSVLRILRIGKVFRVLKISRYNTSLLIIAKTVNSSRWDLWMLCFLLLIVCLFFGSITYYFEQFFVKDSEFSSIPVAIWWALITTLTIGYGNLVPQSTAGRLASSLCAVSGVIIMAPILPIIFNRWTRFSRIHTEAKIHKKCKRLNKRVQEDMEHLNLIRVYSIREKERFFF